MKNLFIALTAMVSVSAFASVKYDCLYMDTVREGRSEAANAFKIKFDESGLKVNNLSIVVEAQEIHVQHIVENKIVTERFEQLGVSNFRFSSDYTEDDVEHTVYMTCSLK